jgi:hypothetical protein
LSLGITTSRTVFFSLERATLTYLVGDWRKGVPFITCSSLKMDLRAGMVWRVWYGMGWEMMTVWAGGGRSLVNCSSSLGARDRQ